MTVCIDASSLVAALIDTGPDGDWAQPLLTEALVAPPLVHAETAEVLRRAAIAGQITDDVASLAYQDMLAVSIELVPFGVVADRTWELRANVTVYDAWYVAVAEALDVPLATLDERLVRAPGPRCRFWRRSA